MNTELCVQNNIPLTASINTVVNEDNIAEDIAESNINEVVNLCEGHVFSSWEEVDKFVKAYGKQRGFGVARKRLERHPDVDTRDHRNRKSKRQECGWHINIGPRAIYE
ncbi:hypothetical protein Glove_90g1 [Diversispora epigaea]|uniref:FAR1 domain-containing protein n=1 Tax=Diversispora epigaea TaxID=1348612 RepID=A0A397J5L2_9GLOM|nr:hypothetical protein Glove_90g1 [Diversispora epigaea]